MSLKAFLLALAFVVGLACAAPSGWGSHKHVRIIVPSHYHTEHIHHHHIEKVHVPVHVPVPVVKKVFIPVETHHEHVDLHHHDDWHGGWW